MKRKQGIISKNLRWPKGIICSDCHSRKISKLSDGRYKCWRCFNRFSDFSGTYLSHNRIPFRKILLLIKLFLMELTASKAAKKANLSYKASLDFFNTCRKAICNHNLPKLNSIESFWAYAKERLIKHHGISSKKFLFYLKELEWRFNHQKDPNLFGILAKYLIDLVHLST